MRMPLLHVIVSLTHGTYNETMLLAEGGAQLGQSEEPEVGGIWPEVGGKPLPILYFDEYLENKASNGVFFIFMN